MLNPVDGRTGAGFSPPARSSPLPLLSSKMSAKAVVGRALRETGAALKQASGAEVRPFLVVMVVVVLGYLLHGDQSGAVLDGGGGGMCCLGPPTKSMWCWSFSRLSAWF